MDDANTVIDNLKRPNASIGQRFQAQFYDEIVSFALAVLIYNIVTNIGFEKQVGVISGLIILIAYMLLADGLPNGQSIGKKITRTACIEINSGLPCSYARSVYRNIFLYLGLIDWIFLIGSQKKRLGDFAAKTRVIKISDY